MELDEIHVPFNRAKRKVRSAIVSMETTEGSSVKQFNKYKNQTEKTAGPDGRASSIEIPDLTNFMTELACGDFDPKAILAEVKMHLGTGLPDSLYNVLTATAFFREIIPRSDDNSFGDSFPDTPDKPEEVADTEERKLAVLKALQPEKVPFDKWRLVVNKFYDLSEPTIRKHLKGGLSDGQKEALDKLIDWVLSKDPERRFFVLKGFAGAGKTFVLRRFMLYLDLLHPDIPTLFTAPTNKATKVLRSMVDKKAITIYSALKLSMTEDEDEQVLTAQDEDAIDIPRNSFLGVDEGSMCNAYITSRIKQVAVSLNLKVLAVGDPAQLRPVGEYSSPIWDLTDRKDDRAFLKEIMRFDNELLNLSKRIRSELASVIDGNLAKGLYDILYDDNDDVDSGVFKVQTRAEFDKEIFDVALREGVAGFKECKVAAWRNKTVDAYNRMIRDGLGFDKEYQVGELVLLAAPLTVEVNGRRTIVANVDDELEVSFVDIKTSDPYEDGNITFPGLSSVPYFDIATVQGHRIKVTPSEDYSLDDNLQALASAAKRETSAWKAEKDWSTKKELNIRRKQRWKEYWAMRKAFTPLRYGYALTTHRLQGSTLTKIFTDAQDIWANPDKEERLQSLYVSCTRPGVALYFV